MTIAVLSDIHGNPLALDAVLADARVQGVERWWLLGDLVAMGPDPVGTVARLRELDAEVRIVGNTDRYVLTDSGPFPPASELTLTPELVDQMTMIAASLAWTKGALAASGDLAWLTEAVPTHRERLADGTDVFAVHASALSDDGPGITSDLTEDELVGLFPDEHAALIVGGHTHDQGRTVNGRRFLNPGSVSNPPSADRRARYALIGDDPTAHSVDLRAVDYDLDAARAMFMTSGLPGADWIVERFFAPVAPAQ